MKEYFGNIFTALSTIFIGMKITFKHMFVPSVTIQYPDVKPQLPERERNRLYVNIDDCIGCDQCSRACPVSCISIETTKALPGEDLGKTSNGKKKALWVTNFTIDFAKCCYCQLCVFPCPTECIYMTDVYEFTEYKRENLVYDFVNMTQDERQQKRDNLAKFNAEKEAEKLKAASEPKPEIKKDQPEEN
jgi:NADH-quinone oxidoreductase subunit I